MLQNYLKYILLGICISFVIKDSFAQILDKRNSSKETDSIPDLGYELTDNSPILYSFANNPEVEYAFKDSLLNNFQQYNPLRREIFDYANLGNLGTPHHPLIYQPSIHQGFDLGIHQYDLYKLNTSQIRFYNIKTAYSQIYYTQGGQQDDAYFKGEFSRSFANGINVSLKYDRMSQLVELKTLDRDGQYPNPFGRNTNFGFGLWYHAPKGKYDGYFSLIDNSNAQDETGGITTDTLFTAAFEDLYSVPIYLEDGFTRHQEKEFAYSQYFRLSRSADSVSQSKRAFTVYHQALYKTGTYKYYDTSPMDDSLYYKTLLTDSRGLRHFIRLKTFENTLSVRTFRLREEKKSEAKSQKDLIEFGVRHAFHWLHQEPKDSSFQNLHVTTRLHFTPSDRLKIKVNAEYGLLANRGDYMLKGLLFFDFKKVGNLEVQLLQQLYKPNLMQHRVYISQVEVWNNDFKKTLETNLKVTYSLPQFQFNVSGQYHLLNNYIYYDTLGYPVQEGKPISILQLIAQKNFKLGGFHLDNLFVLQTTTEDRIRVPNFYFKNSLYWEGKIFKKVLLLRVGLDLRMNSNFYADTYQPLTGQFHLQDKQEIALYPSVDAFLNFKVQRFRFFLKYENMTSLLTEEIFYQTYHYPILEMNFRIGFSWRFSN